ncbi:DUF4349 domain-containing protein [Nocardioides zeae]|uniref:DUF4349 domain-containing protein n=1 Tax=Nocardioides imazamoxiresistens TaxID=3231893 RepID=A0ABU3PYM4_9ACTN|nr:DUF4349 domain-containing protein [Nocardioides zeae]MDT9594365.1 DUF4349 domain-containing protein [Nocardioides zeae]
MNASSLPSPRAAARAPRPPRRARRARRAALVPVLAAAVLLGACSAGDDSRSTSDDAGGSSQADRGAGTESGAAPPQEAPAAPSQGPGDDAADGADSGADSGADGTERAPGADAPREPAIIATGTVDLEADDVAEARRDVQRVADEAGGQVVGEETTTDADGEADGSRLELRVPSAVFDETMTALEGVAEVVSASRSLDDVTTQVVDTEARVRAQQASLTRIEALLGEAEDLAEIVSIEAELTRRQSELDGLSAQLAYLQDATAYSTLTVYLERTDDDTEEQTTDDDGFLAGLTDGWDALASFGGGVAVVAGVLLPWVGLALLLALPVAALVRRRRRGRVTGDATSAATATTPEAGAVGTGLPPRP